MAYPSFEAELTAISYLSPEERILKLEEFAGEAFYIPDEFNRDDQFTVVSNDPNQPLFNVHRGSTTYEDWTDTDIKLALGHLPRSKRYQKAFRHSAQAANKYGQGKRIVEVGHSLGGTLAHHVAEMLNHDSVAFNPGSTPLESARSRSNQHQTYRVETDIISKFDKNNVHVQSADDWTYGDKNVDNLVKANEKSWFLRNYTLSRLHNWFQAYRGHAVSNFVD